MSTKKRSVLAKIRLIKGFSQAEVAAALGVRPSYISMIETGRRHGGNDIREKLANLFSVEKDNLFPVEPENDEAEADE